MPRFTIALLALPALLVLSCKGKDPIERLSEAKMIEMTMQLQAYEMSQKAFYSASQRSGSFAEIGFKGEGSFFDIVEANGGAKAVLKKKAFPCDVGDAWTSTPSTGEGGLSFAHTKPAGECGALTPSW